MKILVVDDDKSTCDTFKLILEEHQVDCANSIKAALNYMLYNDYNIAFVDYFLVDGLATDVFRGLLRCSKVPRMVLITATSRMEYLLEIFPIEAILYKPFNIEDIYNIVLDSGPGEPKRHGID